MFSALSPQGVTTELPELLLQLPPAIERARTSEGSFGSVHLSPANISLVNGECMVTSCAHLNWKPLICGQYGRFSDHLSRCLDTENFIESKICFFPILKTTVYAMQI